MTGGLFALLAIVALLVWFLRRGEGPDLRAPRGGGEVNEAELEAAEREVRDLAADQRPEDGFLGDDWGPGTARPPERL